jgi:hypothetical protein
VEALRGLEAEIPDELELGRRLDAFGHQARAHLPRNDEEAENQAAAKVLVPANDARVDLDEVEGERSDDVQVGCRVACDRGGARAGPPRRGAREKSDGCPNRSGDRFARPSSVRS